MIQYWPFGKLPGGLFCAIGHPLNDGTGITVLSLKKFHKCRARNFHKPLDNYFAMIQLMAGGGVALIGISLVPMLSGLFG